MIELLSIIILGIIVCVQAVAIWKLEEKHMAKETELLNRIMARDYSQYVQAEVVQAEAEKVLTAQEIYERDHERGIPL